MKPFILPIAFVLVGGGAGAGAGLVLSPKAETTHEAPSEVHEAADPHAAPTDHGVEYAKLNNQFIVPVVRDGTTRAVVALNLSAEVVSGRQSEVFAVEPKLRDALFAALLDHARMGGFDEDYTDGENMHLLRDSLRRTAVSVLPETITDVMILDVTRMEI